MAFPVYKLSQVKAQGGSIFDELICVLGDQHITRTNMQIGAVLTAIEAALGDGVQAEALKSLVKEAIWHAAVQFEEFDLLASVIFVAEKLGQKASLYSADAPKYGSYLFQEPIEE